MTKPELEAMPNVLRILANEINAPDHIPATCLRYAAKTIEELQSIINRARVEFFRDDSDAKILQKMVKILDEMP